MKLYTVRIACEVAGQWRTPDVPFPLTSAQARFLAPPLGSVAYPIVLEKPDHGRQHRRQRRSRLSA